MLCEQLVAIVLSKHTLARKWRWGVSWPRSNWCSAGEHKGPRVAEAEELSRGTLMGMIVKWATRAHLSWRPHVSTPMLQDISVPGPILVLCPEQISMGAEEVLKLTGSRHSNMGIYQLAWVSPDQQNSSWPKQTCRGAVTSFSLWKLHHALNLLLHIFFHRKELKFPNWISWMTGSHCQYNSLGKDLKRYCVHSCFLFLPASIPYDLDIKCPITCSCVWVLHLQVVVMFWKFEESYKVRNSKRKLDAGRQDLRIVDWPCFHPTFLLPDPCR